MRRRLLTIAIFLLAGAVVNVGVAWTIAVAGPKWRMGGRDVRKFEWPRPVPDHWAERASERIAFGAFGWRFDQYRDFRDGVRTINIFNAGWPCHALQSETWNDGATRVWSRWRISVPINRSGLGPRTCTRLPGRPVWPGFPVNTIFYAALLWLPFAPFALRRLIRRRRGLCPACAYDLRHAEHEACPECGVSA